jgi:hypothetical protein
MTPLEPTAQMRMPVALVAGDRRRSLPRSAPWTASVRVLSSDAEDALVWVLSIALI